MTSVNPQDSQTESPKISEVKTRKQHLESPKKKKHHRSQNP
jgi:hypothetical protein